MHQEEKAAVNTLIQKLDDLRRLDGRAVVILCTNRLEAIDNAVVRRAGLVEMFSRPSDEERRALFQQDLDGVGLSSKDINRLVYLTGQDSNDGLQFTFSDIRLRLIPEAIARVFPGEPLTSKVLKMVAEELSPSPRVSE